VTQPSTSTLAAGSTPRARRARPHAEPGRVARAVGGRPLLTALVLLGVALRLWAYASNSSLWLDEILLSRNILELPLGELLLRPLRLDQVAPPGFLLVEKLAVLALGGSELALRLFPFLCSVAGVFLFRRLAERTLDGVAVPFAVALFAIGLPFIKYAAEVKQYGVDATAAIVLMLLAVDLRERDASTRRLLLAGAVGLVVVWFSQASVLVMAGLGLACAVLWLVSRDPRTRRMLLVTIPLWAAASLLGLAAGLRSVTPATRAFMDDFWRQGFFPLPPRLSTGARWLWEQALSLFADPTLLRYRWPAVYLVLAALGVAALWRRRRDVALFVVGPVAVALAAAVAQQYPFRSRLMLYLLPGLLLALAAGAGWLADGARRLHSALGATLVLVLAAAAPAAALVEAPPPYDLEHHRDVLGYLQRHRRPGDVVYVFPLTRVGTLFYGPRYGLRPADWVSGVCDREDTRRYLRDVDRFRGAQRFWLLTSGARPYRAARPAVRKYLSAIGVKRDSLFLPSLTLGNVSLELYDLSDPARLRAANAETFPVPPMPTDPRPGCRPWAQPGPAPLLH